MDRILNFLWLAFVMILVCTAVGWRYNMGPAIWIKRSCGKARAQEDDSSRRELVDRVRQILPQASHQNVIFSLQVETHTSGGGRRRVTTYTYYYKLFVADADCLWFVPFTYDKKQRSYQLGQPVALPPDIIQNVTLAGKRGKKLTVTFDLKPEVGANSIIMVLEPLQFKLNKFYPFDFLQEEACDKAMALAEKLALAACGKTAEDLETDRIKDECGNYAIAAGFCGFFGVVAAAVSSSLPLTLGFFAASLAPFGIIFSKKQVPKISVIVVILEAVLAYFLFRL